MLPGGGGGQTTAGGHRPGFPLTPCGVPVSGGGGVHPALGPLSGGLRPCRKDARTPLPDLTAPVRPLPTWKPATHWGPWGSPWPLRLCGPAGASGHPFLGWGGPAGHPSCTTRLPRNNSAASFSIFLAFPSQPTISTVPVPGAQLSGSACAQFSERPPRHRQHPRPRPSSHSIVGSGPRAGPSVPVTELSPPLCPSRSRRLSRPAP